MWQAAFAAVDWGTSNRRMYRLEPDGSRDLLLADDRGVLAVGPGGFEAEVDRLRALAPGLPMLLAGMVGSNRGWREVAYVACPADAAAIAAGVTSVAPDIAIVPGLSLKADDRSDVLRGEEVQAIGVATDAVDAQPILLCHPGTHTKWIRLAGGTVESFRTVMAGEMFGLLRERGILSDLLKADAPADDAFRDGVVRGFGKDDLLGALFEVRARVLLGRLPAAEAASRISGLLIGTDLRTGMIDGAAVKLVASPSLRPRYEAAFAACGIAYEPLDDAAAFAAGMRAIAARL